MIPVGMKLEGIVEVTRDDGGAEKRHVTIDLSQLACDSLTGVEVGASLPASIRMESALRIYLGDKGTDRAAWPYPRFLQGSETQADVRVDLDVESDLWREFEEEARSQGVSVEKLAEHAAFYFAAEESAGRLTQRILADLD